MRVLIDTCVIIDALQERKEFETLAHIIFLAAANELFFGFLSAKSIVDIYYLMHHYTHSDKDSRDVISRLLAIFEILDTSAIDCKRAIFSNVSDFEDALMIETALRCKIDCIVTRNMQDFKKSPLDIYSPQEFLNLLQS